MQSSHNTLGHLLRRKSLPAASLAILMVPSHELDHGEYGSTCFTWQSLSLHLVLNLERVCSLEPSIIRLLGTPSLLNSVDNASCASDFFCIGKALAQPKGVLNTWAYLFFLLEITPDCIVSVKTLVLIRLYLSWRSFVLNLLDNEALAVVLITLWVVASTVLLADSIPISQFCTSASGVIPERFLLLVNDTCTFDLSADMK